MLLARPKNAARWSEQTKRALIRYHRQIMADRGRSEARGKGLLCAQGIEVHGRWWHGDVWLAVQSDPRLKDWMKEQLIGWRNKILSTDEEQGGLRERIAALAPAILPKGVGAYRDCALDFGGDGVAPDDLATAVSTGASLSDWLGQRQTRQEALGRSSSTAFSD